MLENLDTSSTVEERKMNISNQSPPPSAPTVSINAHIPVVTTSAVLGGSDSMPPGTPTCHGHDFNSTLNRVSTKDNDKSRDILDSIMESMSTTGFQATNLALAVEQIRAMRSWRLSSTPWKEGDEVELKDPSIRSKIRARIFFAYTSNQISCGQREVIKFMVQHKMVDVIVTTAGGIEEDLIKCFKPTYMGDFKLDGRVLRKKGINRIGNLLIPNKNYCVFEDWMSPMLEVMHNEQDEKNLQWAKEVSNLSPGEDIPKQYHWTPSKVIERLGKEINNEESVLYWAAKNQIPVFCPARKYARLCIVKII